MVDIVKNEFFGKYADFKGRTDRKTFWLAVLGVFLLTFVEKLSFFLAYFWLLHCKLMEQICLSLFLGSVFCFMDL